MLSYGAYIGVITSISFALSVVSVSTLVLIPNGLFAKILRMTLLIKADSYPKQKIRIKIGKKQIIIKRCSQRCTWIVLLSSIFVTVLLLLLDQCIVTSNVLGPDDICLENVQNCYVFHSTTSFSPSKTFVCNINDPVISANSSAVSAICWGYILKYQTAVNLLDQLGICTSVITFSAFAFWLLQMMTHQYWGLIIEIILMLGILTLMFVFSFSNTPFGPVTFIILLLSLLLTLTIVWIMLQKNPQSISTNTASKMVPDYRRHPSRYNVSTYGKKSTRNLYYRRKLPRHHAFYGSNIRRDLFYTSIKR